MLPYSHSYRIILLSACENLVFWPKFQRIINLFQKFVVPTSQPHATKATAKMLFEMMLKLITFHLLIKYRNLRCTHIVVHSGTEVSLWFTP